MFCIREELINRCKGKFLHCIVTDSSHSVCTFHTINGTSLTFHSTRERLEEKFALITGFVHIHFVDVSFDTHLHGFLCITYCVANETIGWLIIECRLTYFLCFSSEIFIRVELTIVMCGKTVIQGFLLLGSHSLYKTGTLVKSPACRVSNKRHRNIPAFTFLLQSLNYLYSSVYSNSLSPFLSCTEIVDSKILFMHIFQIVAKEISIFVCIKFGCRFIITNPIR